MQVAASRYYVFADFKVIALSRGVVGDALEVANVLDIEPMIDKKRDDFKGVMQADIDRSLKALKDKINTTSKDADKANHLPPFPTQLFTIRHATPPPPPSLSLPLPSEPSFER